MAERLLKTKRQKIAPAKPTAEEPKKVVLVGTYAGSQLADWPGYYPYPLSSDDKVDAESCAKVNEIWLFKGTKEPKYFAAEFVGIKNREELKALGYPAKGKGHGDGTYLLFKIEKTFAPASSSAVLAASVERVIVRTKDFARSPKVRKQLKAYLESTDRTDRELAVQLPEIVKKLPSQILRVCEAAVQLDFWENLNVVPQQASQSSLDKSSISIEFGDSFELCQRWLPPTVIVSDGPYGLKSYPGDPATPEGLADFYRPFLLRWYDLSLPSTTLWFWNSEQGWANCHREIEACGWEFRNCHIWNKGMSHVAGNCNTKTIRKYPVVTEVCAQYVRKNTLSSFGRCLPLKDWMREEWKRTKLPFRLTNVACGVKDAATRKYFSSDHLWYFPPSDAFVKIAAYANEHGDPAGKPYFARSDGHTFSRGDWDLMRAKFHCEIGVSNVWDLSSVRGAERIMVDGSCLHMNQKPLELLELIIRSSSDVGDVVWEPFGGLCSTAIAAYRTNRQAFSAEINPIFFESAKERLSNEK